MQTSPEDRFAAVRKAHTALGHPLGRSAGIHPDEGKIHVSPALAESLGVESFAHIQPPRAQIGGYLRSAEITIDGRTLDQDSVNVVIRGEQR